MHVDSTHAYAVTPRAREGIASSIGGRIRLSPALRKLLVEAYDSSQFDTRADADFNLDESRNNDVRNLIMGYAFSDNDVRDACAEELAGLLSLAKDKRSKPDLLMLACFDLNGSKGVALWTFPQDQAIRLGEGGDRPSLEILEEVFSRTSSLRKAAWYKGRNSRTSFLRGKVLDFQSGRGDEPSKLWIDRFLLSRLSVTDTIATRELAKTLRELSQNAKTESEQKSVVMASGGLSASPRSDWSYKEIADTYFEGEQKRKFLKKVPNGLPADTRFEIDRSVWEKKVGRVSFSLDTGAVVLTPPSEINDSVRLQEEQDVTRLYCEGNIVSQKVKGS